MPDTELSLTPREMLQAELNEIIGSLPDHALIPLKEIAESAYDIVNSGISEVTLQRIIQRIFVRSVNEFFTAEHVSMQMTQERLQRYRASTNPHQIQLPDTDAPVDISFDDVVRQRRSVRDYMATALSQEEFAAVLKRSFGKNGSEDGYGVRDIPLYPYPSMGGLSSFDVGIVVQNVDGIPQGYYRYDQVGHELESLITGDIRLALQDVTFESDWLLYAPFVVVLVHDANSFLWKYHTRGYRIAHIDVGAAMQSLYLASSSAGLGCCAVAGFLDEPINDLLGYNGLDKYVSLVIGVGKPATPLLSRQPH
ncbi:SagB/ThcOx family dehydrogenase [Canibacter zhoujuaniae]|uniref:SagB/ThcOx family dehydrogenase n=1 Tax=Canibacter zhoujuaniae TaxID=2708343 RepID=UPI00141EE5BE|nr:SagB/ThcOx family dehydrogenase [Canibacter zhoujuaniae]